MRAHLGQWPVATARGPGQNVQKRERVASACTNRVYFPNTVLLPALVLPGGHSERPLTLPICQLKVSFFLPIQVDRPEAGGVTKHIGALLVSSAFFSHGAAPLTASLRALNWATDFACNSF
jgi:hypothetical protein